MPGIDNVIAPPIQSQYTMVYSVDPGSSSWGYAIAAEPLLAQAIRTDTAGLMAGDVTVKSGSDTIPAYQAYPDKPGQYPVIVVISEIWGLHEYIRDVARRFAKEGYYAIAPEMFQREGGVGHLTDVQEILKIVTNVPRKQSLQDLADRRPCPCTVHGRRQPRRCHRLLLGWQHHHAVRRV